MKFKFKTKIFSTLLLAVVYCFAPPLSYADEQERSNASEVVASEVTNEKPDAINQAANSDKTESKPVTSQATSNKAQDAINNMLLQSVSLMGIAYKWGGNTPDTGMDCSGFVRYVFKKSLGINLPRTAAEMAKVGKRISLDQLQPGDLIFFNTRRGSNTHIGIYLGGNKFIQSPRTGENIQISELSGYWIKHFNGAKRVVQEDHDENGDSTLETFQDVRNEALPVSSRASSRHGRNSRHASRNRHTNSSKAKSKTKTTAIHNSKGKTSKKRKSKQRG